MSMLHLLWAAGIALAFASWPLVGAYAGAAAVWLGVVTASFTVLPQVILGADAMMHGPTPSARGFFILAVAGIFNGIGVYYYSIKVTDTTINTTVFVVTMLMMLMVWTPILNWVMNGVTLNLRQLLGVAIALLAVYVLNGKAA